MAPGTGSTSPLPALPNSDDAQRSIHPQLYPLQIHGNTTRDDSDDSDDEIRAPLFDPSGLGSSLSSSSSRIDNAGSGSNSKDISIDLNSHSAFRLGISPQQRQPSTSSFSIRSVSSPQQQQASQASRFYPSTSLPRGRSGRAPGGDLEDSQDASRKPSTMDSPIGGAREWWRRDRGDNDPASGATGLAPSSFQSHHPARMASDPGSMASPPLGRSPAAAFLSSLSSSRGASVGKSPTDSAQPVTSAQAYLRTFTDPRAKSLSPSRTGDQSLISSPTEMSSSSSGFQGLGGAAADIYRREREHSNTESVDSVLAPEDEGFCFGPKGRFKLGRQLGFGGFSTIREGWDMACDTHEDPHKVAVKLTYRDLDARSTADELAIWRSLPTHTNLLPLLYDERMVVDRLGHSTASKDADASTKQELELLVMPLCDAGNLMDFIRAEGGKGVAGESSGGSLSRSHSLHQSLDSSQENSRSAGSSLLSRSGPRNSSAHSPSAMQRVPSSASVRSGSILRTSSMRGPRSQGVSLITARSILHQLAQALYCLHCTANVVHGDIKLENVLAQHTRSGRGPSQSANTSLQNAALCWRLADFGLSRKVEDQAESPIRSRPELLRTLSNSARVSPKDSPERSGTQRNSARYSGVENFGGSTAYSAPEVWRDDASQADYGLVSPYAADMWALGCVLYALLSGKLPFNDAFEPRLQAKIAKADWDVPPRLWRRARRLTSSVGSMPSGSRERTSSFRSGSDTSEPQSMTTGGTAPINNWARYASPQRKEDDRQNINDGTWSYLTTTDLSASLPDLPNPHAQISRAGLQNLASAHEGHIVGSVPSRPSAPDRYEIDTEAQAAADAEADAESDEDSSVDQSWNGASSDRASAREVLRGLLEPSPAARWTVERLLASRWLRGSPEAERRNPFESVGRAAMPRGVSLASHNYPLSSVTEGVAVGEEGRQVYNAKNAVDGADLHFEKMPREAASTAEENDGARTTTTATKRPSSLSRSRPRNSDGAASRSSTPSKAEGAEYERGLPAHLRPLSTHSSRTSLGDDSGSASASASVIIHDDERGDCSRGPPSPHLERRGRGRTRSRFMDEVKEDELLSQFSRDGGDDGRGDHDGDDEGEIGEGGGTQDTEPRRARSRPRPIPFHTGSSHHGSNASSRSSSRGLVNEHGNVGSRSKSTSRMSSARRFYDYGTTADDDEDDDADQLQMRAAPSRSKRSSSSASRRTPSSSSLSTSWKPAGPPNLLSSSATTVSSFSVAQHSPHFEYGQQRGGQECEDQLEHRGRERGRATQRMAAPLRSSSASQGKSVSSPQSTSRASTSRSRSRAPDALSQLLRGRGGRRESKDDV